MLKNQDLVNKKIFNIMRFENRRWIFLNADDVSSVNFDQVMQTGQDSLRYNNDETKFFVKYEISEYSGSIAVRPDCYNLALEINGKTEFNHPETLEILQTEDWSRDHLFPTGSVEN